MNFTGRSYSDRRGYLSYLRDREIVIKPSTIIMLVFVVQLVLALLG